MDVSNNKDYIDVGKFLFMKFQHVLLSELLQLQLPSVSYCIGVFGSIEVAKIHFTLSCTATFYMAI